MSKLIDYYKSRKEAIETAFSIITENGCKDTPLELDMVLQYMELQERISVLELCSVLKQYGDKVEPRVAALAGSIAKQMLKPPRVQSKCKDEKTLKARATALKRLEEIYKAGNAGKGAIHADSNNAQPMAGLQGHIFIYSKGAKGGKERWQRIWKHG